MLAAFCPPNIYHQRSSQEMVCILAGAIPHGRRHWGTKAVDGAIWRMKCLDIIKVVRYSSHLNHALSVIGCQALDLRTSRKYGEYASVVESPNIRDEPVLEPDLHLTRAQTRDLSREPFPVRSIRVRLLCKFAHQKTCLLMSESGNQLIT